MSSFTEADTCRKYVLPRLYGAGWDDDQITEQKTFTDGCIIVGGLKPRRGKQKRADYLLRYRPDFTIAVVEAKPIYKTAGDGLQQAKEYAENDELPSPVERSTHDTRKLETPKLMDFAMPVPSLSEQHRIVEYLDDLQAKVDNLKKHQEETSKELDALMPSILSKAFSGEL